MQTSELISSPVLTEPAVKPARDFSHLIHPPWYQPDLLYITFLRRALAPIAHECTGVVVDYGSGSKPWQTLFDRADRYIGTDMDVVDPGDLALTEDGRVPMEDNTADWVVSFSTLEHVPDVPLFLAECHRLLRPGGRLLLVTHGTWPYHPVPTYYGDFWRWTDEGLRAVARNAGLEPLNVTGVCEGWVGLVQQLLTISDPWVEPVRRPLRWCRYGLTLVINMLAVAAHRCLGTRPVRRGDIIPIGYILDAQKPAPKQPHV